MKDDKLHQGNHVANLSAQAVQRTVRRTVPTQVLPNRKTLPHTPPPWVKEDAVYFITLCAQSRGENHFCHPKLAMQLYESVTYREHMEQWWVLLFLLMPDHVHMLVYFSEYQKMQNVISAWKRYTARHFGVQWQRDYFDHRIRSNESLQAKADYIRHNPIRSGLVVDPDDWEFVWLK